MNVIIIQKKYSGLSSLPEIGDMFYLIILGDLVLRTFSEEAAFCDFFIK